MENKKIIVANMKMNLTVDMIHDYIAQMSQYKDFIICPSYIYIPYFIEDGFTVGAQNISGQFMGENTGEISVNQLVSMKIKYVIVGHSDRRHHFNEKDDIINQKVRIATSNNLTCILCIGETTSEKKTGIAKEVIRRQLIEDLAGVEPKFYKNIIIAYEPMWAIGTGVVPTCDEIQEIVEFIKETVNDKYEFVPLVLYGGSTNENNIQTLCKVNIVDGFLIGRASLEPEKLKKIIETVN